MYQSKNPNYQKNAYQGKNSNPPQTQRSYQKLYCSLCGDNDHKASFGCPKMKNNQGKIVMVTPSQRWQVLQLQACKIISP